MNTHRKLITLTLVALVCVTAGLGAAPRSATAGPYTSSPLAHGTGHVSCSNKWFATAPYEHCAFTVEPGSVADADQRLARYSGHATGGAGAAAGAACLPAGPAAFICAIAVAWKADVFIHAIRDAAGQHRCVRVSWDELYGPFAVPFGVNVVPYGQPPRWTFVYDAHLRDWRRVWANPDDCATVGVQPGLA